MIELVDKDVKIYYKYTPCVQEIEEGMSMMTIEMEEIIKTQIELLEGKI